MAIGGYLQLGTRTAGGVVVTPPALANYAAQPVTFDVVRRGVQSSSYQCVFGPVSGSWGRLNYFGVTQDAAGLIPVIPPGILEAAIQPSNGELVIIPPGYIEIEWPTGDNDMFGAPRNLPTVTVVAGGNTQLTATPVPLANVLVNAASGGGDGPFGISLPQACTFDGNQPKIFNRCGAVLMVFPYSGDTVESNGVNAGVAVQNEGSVTFTVANSGLLILS